MDEITPLTRTGAIRMPDEPISHSRSTTTRLLSAGVHLDGYFADAVINELIEKKHRFVAPSYGYDVVPVLGHALISRDRNRLRRGLLAGSVAFSLATYFSIGAVRPALLLLAWLSWAVIFLDRLIVRQTLTQRLKMSRDGEVRFDGSTPQHPLLTPADRERISREQDGDSEVVYYSGYRPFIGSGKRVKSWSFPTLLNPAEGHTSVKEFTGEDMMAHIEQELKKVLRTEVAEVQQIRTLEITRRWYRTAVGSRRPSLGDQPPQPPRVGEEGYDAAREYLCIRIGTWEQELVNSLFINFDMRGQTLYTELHNYVLLPLRTDFHDVDRLPAVVTQGKVCAIAAESMQYMISQTFGVIFGLPAMVWRFVTRKAARDAKRRAGDTAELAEALSLLVRRATGNDEVPPVDDDNEGEIKNFGARRSVREMGSAPVFHHFFQSVDATKYAKIVERRTMEIIIGFLESMDVDTSEYQDRQAAILNYGILQTGSGQILNTGDLAVGENATVSMPPRSRQES
jgi:hypothetical protein